MYPHDAPTSFVPYMPRAATRARRTIPCAPPAATCRRARPQRQRAQKSVRVRRRGSAGSRCRRPSPARTTRCRHRVVPSQRGEARAPREDLVRAVVGLDGGIGAVVVAQHGEAVGAAARRQVTSAWRRCGGRFRRTDRSGAAAGASRAVGSGVRIEPTDAVHAIAQRPAARWRSSSPAVSLPPNSVSASSRLPASPRRSSRAIRRRSSAVPRRPSC